MAISQTARMFGFIDSAGPMYADFCIYVPDEHQAERAILRDGERPTCTHHGHAVKVVALTHGNDPSPDSNEIPDRWLGRVVHVAEHPVAAAVFGWLCDPDAPLDEKFIWFRDPDVIGESP